MRYLIMCRSLTYAQRAAKILGRHAISAGVTRAPAGLSGNGCSYCVTVAYGRGIAAADILRREGLLQGKIYQQNTDGTVKEVFL